MKNKAIQSQEAYRNLGDVLILFCIRTFGMAAPLDTPSRRPGLRAALYSKVVSSFKNDNLFDIGLSIGFHAVAKAANQGPLK